VFGYTLALKGAFEEQQANKPPHCEPGCYGCTTEAYYIFINWMTERTHELRA
jgi:hypothetical protein